MQFARQLQPTVYQRGLWRRLLRSYLVPGSKASALQLQQPLGVWITEPNMKWGTMTWEETLYRRNPYTDSGERSVALHYPRNLVHSDGTPASGQFYDSKPDWYTATIPRLAVPTDISGNKIFLTTHSSLQCDSIPAPAATFAAWVSQLPPAERRLLSSIYFAECDSEEVLVQYLQLDCILFIGTDGGKRHHSDSFSWIICSPGREQLVLNAGIDAKHPSVVRRRHLHLLHYILTNSRRSSIYAFTASSNSTWTATVPSPTCKTYVISFPNAGMLTMPIYFPPWLQRTGHCPLYPGPCKKSPR
jgi:hypothetical protein